MCVFSNMIQVHALVFPNACTHPYILLILGLYFVVAFSFPAVLRSAIQTHQNHFRAHIVTLQTLNFALISYCVSVLVLLGSEDDGLEKQDAIRTALAEILYRLVCVISASVLKNTCEAVLGGDNVPQQLQANDNLYNSNGDGFENLAVAVNGNEASDATICSAMGSYPEFQNAPPPVTGSSDLEFQNAPLPVTGSIDLEFQNTTPPVAGSSDLEFQNAMPAVAGSSDLEFQNAPPAVAGSSNLEFQNVSPPLAGSSDLEFQNAPPAVCWQQQSRVPECLAPCGWQQ